MVLVDSDASDEASVVLEPVDESVGSVVLEDPAPVLLVVATVGSTHAPPSAPGALDSKRRPVSQAPSG